MRDDCPILLVEDDEVDVMLVERAFRKLNIMNHLIKAGNGEEALQLLSDNSQPRPCIILLDLNMPRMNGFEFLERVKADSELRSIPVVILSTSNEERDVNRCYRNQCAGYLVKQVNIEDFTETMRCFNQYWDRNEVPG